MNNSTITRSKAPLRLGLAGGGTDLSPYCDIYGGAVLNATINMYVHCTIIPLNNEKIIFQANDRDEKFNSNIKSKFSLRGKLCLHKAVYNRIVSDFNNNIPLSIKIVTYSDAPSGSGLGGSSTLVVALIKAFTEYLSLPLGEYDIAHLAYEIERLDLKWSGGKQDQYAATFGGFNFIEFFKNDRVIVNPIRLKHWIINELESWIVLYYTGDTRVSAKIIEEQNLNTTSSNKSSLISMHKIKSLAEDTKRALITGDMLNFSSILQKSWINKKATAKQVSNKKIEKIYSAAMKNGAIAGKISGAGGGGFMFYLVNPLNRNKLIKKLNSFEGQVYNFQFVSDGMKGWYVSK